MNFKWMQKEIEMKPCYTLFMMFAIVYGVCFSLYSRMGFENNGTI